MIFVSRAAALAALGLVVLMPQARAQTAITGPGQTASAQPAGGQPAGGQPAGGQPAGGQPITITADQGIEWRQLDHEVIATGNATAIRGNVTVQCDQLIAHYRKKATPPAAARPAEKLAAGAKPPPQPTPPPQPHTQTPKQKNI